ncbi:MAG: zinc metalloprotease HtpX [Dehalococcoidia bacterium]|nr:zinc metalloprotease HtpX [Dehalococcoidia bacterium]
MRARKWYGRDTELSTRMFVVSFLLTAVYLGFLAFLWASGVDFFAMLVMAGIMLGAQYYFSDKMVLWSMGAKEVSPSESPQLHTIVDRLAAAADLPKPKVAIADMDIPNAFATGRDPKHSVVCVTTGILRRLDSSELEGVLAHEISHIKNRDVMVITIATFFSTLAMMLMRWLMYAGMFGGFGGGDRRDNSGSYIMLAYIVSMLVWFISFLLIRTLSRYRELAADRGAVILTGAPSQLASALLKISDTVQRIPSRDLRQVEGMSAFFIVPAISSGSIANLFATHPSIEERLQRLNQMQRDMES